MDFGILCASRVKIIIKEHKEWERDRWNDNVNFLCCMTLKCYLKIDYNNIMAKIIPRTISKKIT